MPKILQGDVLPRPQPQRSNDCLLSRVHTLFRTRLPALRSSHRLNHMEHQLPPLPRQQPAVITVCDNENNDNDDFNFIHEHDFLHPFQPASCIKRQKLRHGDSVELPLLVKSESPDRKHNVANKAHTRAVLSFDGEVDGRVNLSFTGSTSTPKAVVPQPDTRPPRTKETAPYFTHAKHGIRMYCGPGHERFPIAFRRDNKDHEKICNDWDIKIARKRMARARATTSEAYFNDESYTESSDDDVGDANARTRSTTNQDEDLALSHVLEIFPDIQHAFARTKIRSMLEAYRMAGLSHGGDLDASEIVDEILAVPDYPKQTKEPANESQPFETETGRTIQWKRDSRKDATYQKDAVIILANEFDHVPTHFISGTMTEKKSVFESYIFLQDADDNYFSRPSRLYKRLRQPRTQIEKKYQRSLNSGLQRDAGQYADMIDELMAAKQYTERERLRRKNEAKEAEMEATNLEIHRVQGQLVECQCCFDEDIPLNRAVHCQGEKFHWICFSCVKGLADTQIGSMKYEMLCVEPGGCEESLSSDGLAQALSVRTLDRLAFNQQQAEIVAAQIEGLEQCPHCDFKAIVEPIEVDTIFSCQNPDCFKVTCRKCKEPSHLPRTCEEVRKDRGISARHMVEEARSAAMMRECPRCKTKLIKEMGCNKMCCSCGCTFCYVCNADLSSLRDGYEHFNARGSKCPLYDGVGGVERHDRDANEAEEEAIKRARANYEDVAEEELRIETGRSKSAKTRRADNNDIMLNLAEPPPYAGGMQRLRYEMRRIEGQFRERRQPRAFDIPPPVRIFEPNPHVLPRPILPQQPAAMPIIHRPCPDPWPADQQVGMGFEQARRINDFHRDTARRRDNIQRRQIEENFARRGQQGRAEVHPSPIRRQTDPQVGHMHVAPLGHTTNRQDYARVDPGRERGRLWQQGQDMDRPLKEPNLHSDIALDTPLGHPPPYPQQVLPWIQPWNSKTQPEAQPSNTRRGFEDTGKAQASPALRGQHYPSMKFLDDHIFRDPDANELAVWNSLGDHGLFFDGLGLEPFGERDRSRRKGKNAAAKGKGVLRNQGQPSRDEQMGKPDVQDGVDMEYFIRGGRPWIEEVNDSDDHVDVKGSSGHRRRAPHRSGLDEMINMEEGFGGLPKPDRDIPTRRATMPLLTHDSLSGQEEYYPPKEAGGDLSGWALDWAV